MTAGRKTEDGVRPPRARRRGPLRDERAYPIAAPPPASLLDFAGRAVVVTGAGSGLGAGLARRFAQAGAAVVVHHRGSAAGAGEVVRDIAGRGGRAVALPADLTRQADAERLMEGALQAFGRVDVLVNNAGSYPVVELAAMTAEEWDDVVNANLRTVFLCTQAAARRMIARGGGAIVNVASIEGATPSPGHSHYGAAKAAVIAHTRAAAQELARHGVRVNAVSPGLIWRDGIERSWPDGVRRWHARAPLGRMGMAEDVADACLFLASPAARWITGANLVVDGGVSAAALF